MVEYTIYCRREFMRMSGWTLFFYLFVREGKKDGIDRTDAGLVADNLLILA